MGLNRFPINDFTGGLNLRDDPSSLQGNETPNAMNVTLGPVGQLQQRPPSFLDPTYGSFSATLSAVDHMYLWERGSTVLGTPPLTVPTMVASNDGDVYTVPGLVRIFDGTPGAIWSFENMNNSGGTDTLWMCNGRDVVQKWDGRAGSTSMALGAVAGSGNYLFKSWKNRMFLCNGNAAAAGILYFSPVGDPEGTQGFVRLGQQFEPIVDMEELGDNLIVFTRKSVWMVFDPVSMANRRVGEPGCEGRFQVTKVNNRLYWFSRDGIFSMGVGGDIRNETDQVNPIFNRSQTTPSTLNPPFFIPPIRLSDTALATARVDRTPNRHVLVSFSTGAVSDSVNDTVLELIPDAGVVRTNRRYSQRSAVFVHKYGNPLSAAIAPRAFAYVPGVSGTEDRLIASFPNGGLGLYDITSGLSSPILDFLVAGRSGVNIISRWFSAWRGIQEEEPIERIRRLNVTYGGQIRVQTAIDFLDTNTFSVDLPNHAGQISGLPPVQFEKCRPESRGRYHQIRIFDREALYPPNSPSFTTGGRGWLVSGLEVVYRGGKEH